VPALREQADASHITRDVLGGDVDRDHRHAVMPAGGNGGVDKGVRRLGRRDQPAGDLPTPMAPMPSATRNTGGAARHESSLADRIWPGWLAEAKARCAVPSGNGHEPAAVVLDCTVVSQECRCPTPGGRTLSAPYRRRLAP
jgi:hypothetical protein